MEPLSDSDGESPEKLFAKPRRLSTYFWNQIDGKESLKLNRQRKPVTLNPLFSTSASPATASRGIARKLPFASLESSDSESEEPLSLNRKRLRKSSESRPPAQDTGFNNASDNNGTDEKLWECEACTFKNIKFQSFCEMCDSLRKSCKPVAPRNDRSTEASPRGEVASEIETWSCVVCTLENSKLHKECEACGQERPGSAVEATSETIGNRRGSINIKELVTRIHSTVASSSVRSIPSSSSSQSSFSSSSNRISGALPEKEVSKSILTVSGEKKMESKSMIDLTTGQSNRNRSSAIAAEWFDDDELMLESTDRTSEESLQSKPSSRATFAGNTAEVEDIDSFSDGSNIDFYAGVKMPVVRGQLRGKASGSLKAAATTSRGVKALEIPPTVAELPHFWSVADVQNLATTELDFDSFRRVEQSEDKAAESYERRRLSREKAEDRKKEKQRRSSGSYSFHRNKGK